MACALACQVKGGRQSLPAARVRRWPVKGGRTKRQGHRFSGRIARNWPVKRQAGALPRPCRLLPLWLWRMRFPDPQRMQIASLLRKPSPSARQMPSPDQSRMRISASVHLPQSSLFCAFSAPFLRPSDHGWNMVGWNGADDTTTQTRSQDYVADEILSVSGRLWRRIATVGE